MENKVRVEYLFPNIDNKRKLEWLKHANIIRRVEDHEIVSFNLEEFLYRLRREGCRFEDSISGDITEEKNCEDYKNWHERSQSYIYDLCGRSFVFDNTITEALSQYLYNHPLAIPYFLEKNAINIIGLFLGKLGFYTDVALTPFIDSRDYELQSEKTISKEKYSSYNVEAKYQFTLFVSVIKQLLYLGINLEEYHFVELTNVETYQELGIAPLWKNRIKAQDYTRLDGVHFSASEMANLLSFTTLTEFLDCVIDLTETEYYIDFNDESMMLDPYNIKPFPKYSVSKISDFGEENLLSVKAVCQTLKEQLNIVKRKSEEKVLSRKLSTLKSKIAKIMTVWITVH